MSRVCSGCGLMSCQGECYDASPSDYAVDPIAEFRELGERIEREATAKTEAELRSTMKMQRRVA